MVAFPWYLLALGLILVVLGTLFAGLSRASRAGQRAIDSRMRDAEIIQHLRSEQRLSLPSLIMGVGFVCVMVSVVWRLARFFR
jgi:hypothetical protein